jgi:hypothetical protein
MLIRLLPELRKTPARAVQANGNREATARFFDARPLDALHGPLWAAALELLGSEVVAEHQ